MEERAKMKRGEIEDPVHTGWNLPDGYFDVKRSDSYGRSDEQGNNKVPYCWVSTCGLMQWFGQYIDYWMLLPEPPESGVT